MTLMSRLSSYEEVVPAKKEKLRIYLITTTQKYHTAKCNRMHLLLANMWFGPNFFHLFIDLLIYKWENIYQNHYS